MAKHELLADVIRRFSEMAISGPMNWKIASEVMEMLIALQEGLVKDDELNEKRVKALEKQLAAKPPVVFNDDGTITLGGEVLEPLNQNGGEN